MVDKPKLYLETSIVSYLVSRPSPDVIALSRQNTTRIWWDRNSHEYSIYVSSIILSESSQGDESVARKRLEILEKFPVLAISSQVEYVAGYYMEKGIVPVSNPGDALHLAFASIYGMDVLATWNFKHLANIRVRRLLRNINVNLNIPLPDICTPDELMGD